MRFQNATIIVTGGASGIGRATIERALEEGAAVLAVDRDADALRDLKAEFDNKPLETLAGDVADADLAAKGVEVASGMGAALKGVVTAAGISKSGQTIQGVSAEDWDEVFRVNVRGSWTWLRAALPAFEAHGGGSVVFLASQLAFGGGVMNASYIASKGAIVSLAKAAALELAPQNIRVNAVAPGAIDTPMLRRSMSLAPDEQSARARSLARHAMRRFGEAPEIASPILYLLSDEASFITGHTMLADGGWTAA
jgi:NAD(P)-dependent dehydrogenase (short-subunit alcohol dehydrogenase family)